MRLWTLHPKYLDARGWWRSGARCCWRKRFCAARPAVTGIIRNCAVFPSLRIPPAALAAYLTAVHAEAVRRGYKFDASKIGAQRIRGKMTETRGQLLYEWRHL